MTDKTPIRMLHDRVLVAVGRSPNGKKIVAAWPGGGLPGNADLYVMNLDGSHLRNITNSPPTWESSPDWGPRAS